MHAARMRRPGRIGARGVRAARARRRVPVRPLSRVASAPLLLGSILDNGAVYYPLLFGIPVVAGIVVAWRRVPRRRALWILGAVCAAETLVDLAFDEERSSDLPFFVVVGLILFGLAAFVRWLVLRLRRPGRAGE